MTLEECLTEMAEQFTGADLVFGHGTDNAWDEAVALALGLLEWSDDRVNLSRELSSSQQKAIESLLKERIERRVPVPLLLGTCQFAGLTFETAEHVMIPRSPIGELVRSAFAPWYSGEPRRILDVCCGGGCIGIACADQFPEARVWLSDVSTDAVALARRNIARHQLADRVSAAQGDLYEPAIAWAAQGPFDLIVSNPPYVPSAEAALRPPEFLHEPLLAYDGGEDGLALVQRLLAGAAPLLADDGLLVIEVGQWRDAVEARWPQVPFSWPDLLQGGEGVLVLEAAQLAEHTAQLAR